MTPRIIRRCSGVVDATIRAPGSKSVTHRALVAAALACGDSRLIDPLDAEDTRVTADGLRALGVSIRCDGDVWTVRGTGAEIRGGGRIELRQSGTSMRFLAAVACLGDEPSTLDGDPRLAVRPMDGLYDALRSLGARIEPARPDRALPALVGGSRPCGGRVEIEGHRTSQFASALILLGARLPGGIDVGVAGDAVSFPYVRLTADVLRAFGVEVERAGARFRVREVQYRGTDVRIEGDHSSASCLLAAAAVLGGRVRVEGVRPESTQPDARFGALLERLGLEVARGDDFVEARGSGAVPGFDVDLRDAPDLVPAAAALALFADGPCTVEGIAHVRDKESDRIAVLVENLVALGRPAEAGPDRLIVGPASERLRPARVRTAGDHRMAMAFAIVGLRIGGVSVDDPGCVAKSFPGFWGAFSRLERAGVE